MTSRIVGASRKMAWVGRKLMVHLSTPVPVIVTRRNQPVKPLALGSGKNLLSLSTSRTQLRRLIKAYTNRTTYWRALAAEGSLRYGLDGQPVGEVSAKDRENARLRIEKRRSAKYGERRAA